MTHIRKIVSNCIKTCVSIITKDCEDVTVTKLDDIIFDYVSTYYKLILMSDSDESDESDDTPTYNDNPDLYDHYIDLANLFVVNIGSHFRDVSGTTFNDSIFGYIESLKIKSLDIELFRMETIKIAYSKYLNTHISLNTSILIDDKLTDLITTNIDNTDITSFVTHGFDVANGLVRRYGIFQDDYLITYLENNTLNIKDIISPAVHLAYINYTARDNTKAILYNLFKAVTSKEQSANLTNGIEKSCYNETIDHCKISAESYTRQWNSEMFINIYSSRIGIIVTHIDPSSSVVKRYGNLVMERLLIGELDIDTIGSMSEEDLCPKANAQLRADIEFRMSQKIVPRTSNMFKCPKCAAWDCVYIIKQLAGADEPSTYVCKCNQCKAGFNG
jgi:DNA-directed RNA polymerase subunit M/transcription elongation factor TFIIS